VFAPSDLPPRLRQALSEVVNDLWAWIAGIGMIGSTDRRARRFAAFGAVSGIGFPPGSIFGEEFISVGTGTLIGPYVSLAAGMAPGEPLVPPGDTVIRIGDRCNIGRGSSIIGRRGIDIGDDVTTGPNVYITDHNHDYQDLAIPIARQWPTEDAVTIGSGTWLGTGCVVLPGARVGCHVVIGAGSVVRGVIPDRCVAVGVPARVVRRWMPGEGWVPSPAAVTQT
jgi:serine acetyltransferase